MERLRLFDAGCRAALVVVVAFGARVSQVSQVSQAVDCQMSLAGEKKEKKIYLFLATIIISITEY